MKTLKKLVTLGAQTHTNTLVFLTGRRHTAFLKSTATPPGPPWVSYCLSLWVIPQVPSSRSSPLQHILSLRPVLHPHSAETHTHRLPAAFSGYGAINHTN